MEEVGKSYSFVAGGWLAALLIIVGNVILGGGLTANGIFPFSTFAFFLPWPQETLHWYSLRVPLAGGETDIVTSPALRGGSYPHLVVARLVQKIGQEIERGESASTTLAEIASYLPFPIQSATLYLDTSNAEAEYLRGETSAQRITTLSL